MNGESSDLELARYEARIVFKTEASLPLWSGNILRSGFGARLREMVCARLQVQDDCIGCPLMESCAYDFFYNSRLPEGAEYLRKQKDIPRPFTFEPPVPGRYEPGSEAFLGFTYSANILRLVN